MRKENWLIGIAAGAGLAAVAYKILTKSNIPEEEIVKPFDKEKFLGKWFEVARLESRIEKNLSNVTEHYSLNDDGTIKVITRAYNTKDNEWREFTGKLKFAGDEEIGMMRVSYLRPVYFAYNVLDVDPDYQYTLVSSGNLNYLWILSRKQSIPGEIKARFLKKAESMGFDTTKLEWA